MTIYPAPLADMYVHVYDWLSFIFQSFYFFFLLHIHLISNVLCNSFYDEGHKAKHVGVTIKLLCTGVAGVHSIIFGHFYPLHVLCNLTIYLN